MDSGKADSLYAFETEAQVGGLPTLIDLPRIRIHIVEGPDQGRYVDSDEQMLVRIGTRESNDLILTDKSVSGYHAEIVRQSHGWRLHDLGSTNGTFVGGLRVYDLILVSGTAVRVGRTKLRIEALSDEPVRAALHPGSVFGDMVGTSVAIRRVFSRISQVAGCSATVLISGETGTGKEAVAEALVQASPRASEPFVVIDCSALPSNLIESELFGHVRGAFTGAHSDYRGAFERADGGTVFLDEIGELPLELQPKLLRVLERREVRRIGAERTRPIDVRVLAATNRALSAEVNERRFRQDLYYRLSVVNLHIPPLRERREDIPLLVEHFYNRLLLSQAPRPGEPSLPGLLRHTRAPQLSEIIERLCAGDYTWPGNVRELRNAVERAFHIPDEDPVSSDERQTAAALKISETEPARAVIDLQVPFKVAKQQLIDGFERAYLEAMLKATRNNISEAARRAQIDRMHLYKLITQHRLNQ